ncbi:MAG: D-aminoacyl-tRNA deacylase [Glaciecola sp.]|jgi:D-aminoacyl-tRNA deacylase|nr:D-aminoacyl-tRNA deacylase [Glaciecola sp.]MDG1815279.1 D-aminoacyl-tRNA deacylase [Glaciecola sp.]MDG2099257.1 D-aminoacyl-tRNA deacylase [Glaciecola sp.]
MIGLIQRVKQASVSVEQQIIGQIGYGALLLLGVEAHDSELNAQKMVDKLIKFRMFSDDAGKMNWNIEQITGDILVVSQFTLVADTTKGNRPGFSRGASPAHGEAMYNAFITELKSRINLPQMRVATGQFGADMQVALVNDGPVTFSLQT